MKNCKKAKLILFVYLIATLALLLLGYSVRKPKAAQQEFPFSITYSYQGKTETISDVFVGEYVRKAMYLGEDSLAWSGYIKDRNRLESDFYRIAEIDGQSFSINLNISKRWYTNQIFTRWSNKTSCNSNTFNRLI